MSLEEMENQMALTTILGEIIGGAEVDMAKLNCEEDSEKRVASFKRSIEFYSCLAEELNDIVKKMNPSLAIENFKGQINSIRGRGKNTRKLINNMKGGVGKEIVPYENKQGRPGKLSVYRQGNIEEYYGMEAAVIIREVHTALENKDIGKAMELSGVVDDLVKADARLEKAMPFVSVYKASLVGAGLGGILGVALFYLAVIGIASVPAGLAAGTAQYTANLAANSTRTAASFVTFGSVSKDVAQPDPIETARTAARGIQGVIQATISNEIAASYMITCAIACMGASFLLAKGANVYIYKARLNANEALNKRKQTIRNRAKTILSESNTRFDQQREKNLALLNLRPGASKNNIKKAYKSKLVQYHPDKHVNNTNNVKDQMAKKFQELQEAHERLNVEEKAPKRGMFW